LALDPTSTISETGATSGASTNLPATTGSNPLSNSGSSDQVYQPGFVNFKSAYLNSPFSNQKIDITDLIDEVAIYENIMRPFVTCSVFIHDATSLMTLFPLTGDETLTFELAIPMPCFPEPYSVTLRVTGINDVVMDDKPRSSHYVIRAWSPEAIQDWTTTIRKSYSGMPVSDMVKKVAKTYLNIDDKKLKASASQGNRTIVIPNMHPSKALKFLSREAQSQQYPASNFVFYSDSKGYYFKTVEEMMTGQTKDKYFLTEKNYFPNSDVACSAPSLSGGLQVDPNILDTIKTTGAQQGAAGKPFEWMKVSAVKIENTFDLENHIKMGAFDNSVTSLDPNVSLIGTKTYNYVQDYQKFQRTDKAAAKMTFQQSALNKLKGFSHMRFQITDHPHNKTDPDTKDDFLHLMVASGAMLTFVKITITVPGDPTRHVGDVIRIGFPEFSAFDETIKEENGFLSGDYLVTELRNMWSRTGNGYQLMMTCVKNCYAKSPETTTKPMSKTSGIGASVLTNPGPSVSQPSGATDGTSTPTS
jgi:hypothetical protein